MIFTVGLWGCLTLAIWSCCGKLVPLNLVIAVCWVLDDTRVAGFGPRPMWEIGRYPLIGKCFNEGRWQQASGAVLEYTDALVATRTWGVGIPKDPHHPIFTMEVQLLFPNNPI